MALRTTHYAPLLIFLCFFILVFVVCSLFDFCLLGKKRRSAQGRAADGVQWYDQPSAAEGPGWEG